MRIFAIRGQDLASLAGPFEVALDSAPLADHGLFAITGPVGAGKSTLLDALCLALFDRTPRLADRGGSLIGAADDPARIAALDVRGILRRGAGSGWAEVDFRGRSKRRMRARWSVRRARERADGRFQAQEVSLVDLEDGRVLGGSKRETLDAIEAELGLTFEQFRRSVVLAQGEFAAFLSTGSAERAALLERMTDTGIYGALSIAAHQRAGDARAELGRLEDRLASIAVLGDDQRGELDAQCAAVESVLERLGRADAALEQRDRLSADVAELDRLLAQLAERAERETEVEAEACRAAEAARQERAARDAAWTALAAELDAGRALDRRLASVRAELATETDRLEAEERELALAAPAVTRPRASVELSDAWADFVRELRRLAAITAKAEEQDRQLDNARIARAEAARALATARERLAQREQQLEQAASPDDESLRCEAERAAADAQREVDRLGDEHAQKRAALAALRARAGLAEHRAQLVDGEPCPLCGSTEHPGVPETPESEADHEAALARLEREFEDATRRHAAAGERAAAAAVEAVRAERERRHKAWLESRDEVLEGERDLRERDARIADFAAAREDLRSRESEARTALDEMLAARRAACARGRERVAELARDADSILGERRRLLDGRAVDEVENEWRDARTAADRALESAQERLTAASRNAADAVAERRTQAKRREEVAARLGQQVAVVAEAAARAGVAEPAAEELRAALARVRRDRDDLHVRRALDDNARREREALGRGLEELRERTRPRLALGELIGSADGRKFRAFAQGLSFEQLLAHANRHLVELTPRYRLMRVPSEHLDLQIVDREMGEEMRSVHSLSGGETFIVSLALALGLATMSARHAAFETLFIDEGLGTLDAQSLETVLGALDALQATGYQVGVISHVDGLAERVGARVDVLPRGGGRSEVRVVGGMPVSVPSMSG